MKFVLRVSSEGLSVNKVGIISWPLSIFCQKISKDSRIEFTSPELLPVHYFNVNLVSISHSQPD